MNDEDNYIEGWRRAKRVLVIAVKQVVLHRGITLGFLLVAINTVTMVVVENNQKYGVSPVKNLFIFLICVIKSASVHLVDTIKT